MAMSKHTPGPWAIRRHWSNEDAFEIYPDRGDPGYGEWASIVEIGDYCYEDEAEANARLIAAAPDMLDMLKVCHSALEYVGPWETPVGLIERVRDLIQKVEGNDEN